MAKVFSNIPFFRILIPFVIGILTAIQFHISPIHFIFLPALIAVALICRSRAQQTVYTKRLFLFCFDVFFFLFAVNLVYKTNTSYQNNYYGRYIKNSDSAVYLSATINDLPVEKENFVKCLLKVNEIKAGTGFKTVDGNIIAYFKKPLTNKKIKPGSTLILKAKLLEIDPPKNPYEFDYKTYLYNKQIYHTTFVDNGTFEIVNVPQQLNPVWYFGLFVKEKILQRLKNSGLTYQAYGICAALLTGYDDEIDKQVVESFSHSGTLHVLSVSGLHTGLIYLVLAFLFDLADKKKKYKILKFSVITLLLWSFALITGFSAPVLRAVIMFNLLGFGKIFYRSDYRNQVNILLVSAFILLCYDPFFITDVGFLLSYFAVFGLLYFQPKLAAGWQPHNKIANWLWQGTTVSFAATISTLPLTLFFFKQFPLWFFVCNIVVIPVSFVVLLLAFFAILKLGIAAVIINYIIKWLVAFISFFNSAKFGFVDNIDFGFYDAVFLSILIILTALAFQNRSYRLIRASFGLLICWQIISIMLSYYAKTESLVAVYQTNKSNYVLTKNSTNSILNQLDSAQFVYHIKPHVTSFNNTNLSIAPFNYLEQKGKTVLILNQKDRWPDMSFKTIDFLVLANNFRLYGIDMEAFSELKTVILDGSNNNYSVKKAEELCRKFDVELIKTKQKGAYILNL